MALTYKEIKILIFLARNRMQQEARRKPHIVSGHDIQSQKVYELQEIIQKLEEMQLAK